MFCYIKQQGADSIKVILRKITHLMWHDGLSSQEPRQQKDRERWVVDNFEKGGVVSNIGGVFSSNNRGGGGGEESSDSYVVYELKFITQNDLLSQ